MKPLFTNKWVLTGSLLMALGFNMALNKHEAGVASADFASTLKTGVVESKLHTAQGVVPVKYIDNGEDKVIAIIPKKMTTEGAICDNCGLETITLSVKNKEDIDALNVELLKALQKTRDTVITETASDSEFTVSEIPTEDVDYFASLEKCDDKSSESAVLDCRTKGFLKVLKNKKIKVSQEDALEYYQENIETLIASRLTESRNLLSSQRRGSVMPQQQWFAIEDSFNSEDASSIRQETLGEIEDLISSIPKGYGKVRDRLLVTQTLILKAEALELQATMNQSRTTTDPQTSVFLMQEGQLRKVDLQDLMSGMLSVTHSGLQSADLSGTQKNYYMNSLNGYTTQLYQGMNTNIYGFADAPTTTVTPDSRTGGASRVSTLPISTTPSNADLIFEKQSQIFTGQAESRIVIPSTTTPLVTPTGTVLAPVIPDVNNGIVFGTPITISPESLILRQEMRAQFPQ